MISWAFVRALIPLLLGRLLDQPNARSSHLHPTPRGGGIGFVCISLVVSSFSLFSSPVAIAVLLPLIAAPLAIVGLVDDRYSLPASWRYGVQLAVAALLLLFSPLVYRFLDLSAGLFWYYIPVILLLLISVTAVINFTNFMDGLDGLVAGSFAVAVATVLIQLSAPLPLWALVGSLLGFLVWNWSPAKVFMGDVGSTFLGAVFAGFVLQSSSWHEAFGLLLICTPIFGDAFSCVLRRLRDGQPVFQAHRLHLFQRLHQAGWSHSRVSLSYILATSVLAVAMLAGGWPWVLSLAVAELLLGVWLDQRVAVPFALASKN